MAALWAKRLVAGTQSWDKVPLTWRSQVKAILAGWVENHTITSEQYTEITGEYVSEAVTVA